MSYKREHVTLKVNFNLCRIYRQTDFRYAPKRNLDIRNSMYKYTDSSDDDCSLRQMVIDND